MGTSPDKQIVCRFAQDHPHAYGDKAYKVNAVVCRIGSSPRVWGQGRHPAYDNNVPRIIPTRMGTSLFCQDIVQA